MNTVEQLKIDKQIVEQKIASELLSLSEKYGGNLSFEINLEKFETMDAHSRVISNMFDVKLNINI